MCSIYSVYDELEGRADCMVAYLACHLCHNGNKKCERPASGGQCKRCATTYIPRGWASNENPPSFSDFKITDHVWALLQALPSATLSLFENPHAYHTMTMSLASSSQTETAEPYRIHFLGPFRQDNANLVQQFDQIVHRDWSVPRVDICKDLHGLVARACLAGGYLNLFFSIDKINNGSQGSLDTQALILGLAHFMLMRISSLISDVMYLGYTQPMSRNARLSLTALHVILYRIKLFASRQACLRPLYDNVELSTLLKDRIHAIEGELRQLFQDDCGLIKDWGAPLTSPRKEFKNTSQSIDPLTLTIAINTMDDSPGHDMYPNTIDTPSESGLSPQVIELTLEINLPGMQFAGLEDNQPIETEGSEVSDQIMNSSGVSGTARSIGDSDVGMESIITYDEDNTYQSHPFHLSQQEILIADPQDDSPYGQPGVLDNALTEWEILFNSDQMSNIDYQEQDLGSPFHWGGDPGASDVALD